VRWHPSQVITEDWNITWREALPLIEHSERFSRYAAFKVKVTFQNRSREYKALFVFGDDPSEPVRPVDTISGLTSALHFFLKTDAYPGTLIEGKVGSDPLIFDRLSNGKMPSGKPQMLACDPATVRCGIRGEDL